MKKIISLFLALVMIMSLSVTAFAAEDFTESGSTTINVTGNYVAGGSEAEVISVNVEMSFTYTDASEGTWKPADHSYTDGTEAGWTAKGNTITVTNHSNVPVDADFEFAKRGELNIAGEFSQDSISLERAEAGSALDSQKAEVTFTITGSISATAPSLGTITVYISNGLNG